MIGSDLMSCGLFLAGLLISLTAESRLRRVGAASWATGCITAAGAALVLAAGAAAIR